MDQPRRQPPPSTDVPNSGPDLPGVDLGNPPQRDPPKDPANPVTPLRVDPADPTKPIGPKESADVSSAGS